MTVRNPMTEVMEIERGFWNAAGDTEYYRRYFHDDGVMVLPHESHPLDKAAVLASLAGAAPWRSFHFDAIATAEPSPSVAVLAYRVEAWKEGVDAPYRAVIASTYLAEGTSWRLLSHQHTPLNEP